jgi:hypothetical protein
MAGFEAWDVPCGSAASQNSSNSAASQPASKRPPEITLPSSLSQPSSYGYDKCPHHLEAMHRTCCPVASHHPLEAASSAPTSCMSRELSGAAFSFAPSPSCHLSSNNVYLCRSRHEPTCLIIAPSPSWALKSIRASSQISITSDLCCYSLPGRVEEPRSADPPLGDFG